MTSTMDPCHECGGSFDPDFCLECNRTIHYECLVVCGKDYNCTGMFCSEHEYKHECLPDVEE